MDGGRKLSMDDPKAEDEVEKSQQPATSRHGDGDAGATVTDGQGNASGELGSTSRSRDPATAIDAASPYAPPLPAGASAYCDPGVLNADWKDPTVDHNDRAYVETVEAVVRLMADYGHFSAQ
jgi:hypothetical protein